jgi:antitoxin component of RelBE/YafQ-DinJ toxin-antitoxin module
MKDAVVRGRVATCLQDEVEALFEEPGLATTETIRMFPAQVRLRRGIPFAVTLPAANADLLVSGSMRQSALDQAYDDRAGRGLPVGSWEGGTLWLGDLHRSETKGKRI